MTNKKDDFNGINESNTIEPEITWTLRVPTNKFGYLEANFIGSDTYAVNLTKLLQLAFPQEQIAIEPAAEKAIPDGIKCKKCGSTDGEIKSGKKKNGTGTWRAFNCNNCTTESNGKQWPTTTYLD